MATMEEYIKKLEAERKCILFNVFPSLKFEFSLWITFAILVVLVC